MRRTRRLYGVHAAVAALFLAVLVVPATASAAQKTVAHDAAVTKAAAGEVGEYWTPKRMRAATPIDRLLPRSAKQKAAKKKVAKGEPSSVQPTQARDGLLDLLDSSGDPWTGGGDVVETAGRVFFTYDENGTPRDASCSGNAVTSANKSTVMTAGHCVKLDGNFHTNWTFVPGYDDGEAPYGEWTAKQTLATPQWVESEDINYDVGAAVVNTLDGKSLTDVVGGQGVAFNQERGQDMSAFGYPAADPYDGTTLIYCSGTTFGAIISDGIGMSCDMTGGASGGPWFQEFDESTGTGLQNSVNSYKINGVSLFMFGPYFGTEAEDLYEEASGSSAV